MTTTATLKTVRVLQFDADDGELLSELCGLGGNTREEETAYFNPGGDFWLCEPDYVKVDGVTLAWGETYGNTCMCNFDPDDYDEHAGLIRKSVSAERTRRAFSYDVEGFDQPGFTAPFGQSTASFESIETGIAYRGGSGYCYGLFVPNGLRHEITPSGDLKITCGAGERARLIRDRAFLPSWPSSGFLREIFGSLIANSELEWIRLEEIGALTDAPILGYYADESTLTNPVRRAWWYLNYALRSPLDDLADNGFCIFDKGE